MNKTKFRLLVFFMSLSLIGIILVQLYWINSSLKNSEEQFKFHIQQVLGRVADNLKQRETYEFIQKYNRLKDSLGKTPTKSDLLPLFYIKSSDTINQNIIYSDNLISEDYRIDYSTIDKMPISDKNTKIGLNIDRNKARNSKEKEEEIVVSLLEKVQFDLFFKDYLVLKPLQNRISKENLDKIIKDELAKNGITSLPFEFGIYSNGLATKIKSENFKYDVSNTFTIPIFADNEGNTQFRLYISFPQKKTFLFNSIMNITLLSVIFTFIILVAYLSAINQLVKQKQISEIKTDFINNMTHEFKTPIATINLALDAIKNPKIFEDPERRQRYLEMIREENKRMHAQVENVLQISKLDRKELEINKEQADINSIIEDAIEHVNLIVENRGGKLNRHLNAKNTTVLVNGVHFTNVIVNILDNAIKYSTDEPVIDIYTEEIKGFLIIRIKDKGIGISKNAQKRIFEKFYREHTGDIHNVKGHGLGLAYVKRIVAEHNGQIYLESEKGKGSTFIIKMPLIN